MGSKLVNARRFGRADGAFVFAMALAAAVYGTHAQVPLADLGHLLEPRIAVLNCVFAGLFVLMWNSCFDIVGLYKSYRARVTNALARIAAGSVFMSAVLAFYLTTAQPKRPNAKAAALFFCCAVLYQAGRFFANRWIATRDPQLVVILGTGPRAVKAWREICVAYGGTVKLVGFVDDRPVNSMPSELAGCVLGTTSHLSDLLLRNVVDDLLVAVPMKSCYDMAQQAIGIAERVGVRVVYMQDMYNTTVEGNAMRRQELFNELLPLREYYVLAQGVKRLVDIIGAAIGLCLLSPLFLVVAITIKTTSKGPVFFSQDRFGYRRRIFRMHKFRSMVSNASQLMAQLESQNEAKGPIFKIRRDPRITPVGRILRASSLDELPQLWNVLIGNMSLVGPRPMSVRDVSLFSEATLMRRFTVKPGITGLWQVSGRSTVGFEKWIELDFTYIDRWSLSLDFQILARTVRAVLKGTGAV
jgi:exopolysaccharide biosynthesis polyprenyl glycosylphosphotransferase